MGYIDSEGIMQIALIVLTRFILTQFHQVNGAVKTC